MEDMNLTGVVAKRWPLIVFLVLVIAGASWAVSGLKPASVDATMTVNVVAQHTYPSAPNPLIFQNNSQQDTNFLVATSSAWVTDPSYVQQVVDQSGASDIDRSLKGLAKVFKVNRPVDQSGSFQVQFSAANESEDRKLSAALRDMLNKNASTYNDKQVDGPKMALYFSDLVLTTYSSSLPLTPIAGLAVGVVFALTVATLLERKKA